jgi:8-oxo-dGTP pyrophosphatase MutT (NUDIX family)
LSPLKQATPASSNDNGLEKSRTILDATLVGDYLVQMSSTGESFAWQLYSIRDVVQASLTGSGSYDEGIIWTDGTRATEALSYGLSSAAAEALSGLTPRAELLCFPSTDGDAFDSKALWVDEGNPGGDKILLLLLQILQAQWVDGIQGTQRQHEPTTTSESSGNTDDEWRISRDSLLSQEGISGLFGEAGLLDGDARDMEWVEMMTGSSRIVGRLPRSFVHKFNVLHRGIGAFITRDRPIDVSSLQSSSSPTTPVPDLYVHRRSADKRIFPSLYDMFVGGVSLAGEDSELSAQREIAEELGLSRALSTSLVAKSGGGPLLTCLVCTAYNRCLVDLFQYTMDTSIETVKWQEEEVAWGDFVDYQVISASADLSMQRAAADRTWPGSYPPIQSELRGVLPEEESSKVANYDGNWKEWNYVPDGLLVWKAWLEMIETNKDDQQQRQIGQPVLSFEVEFSLGDGNTEVVTVELESMKDIVPQSQQLSARFNTDINDMQSMLKQMWADATVVPVYDGPSLAIESIDDHAECTIELPSGLVLELRPSTIGEDAGLGLFVRKASPRVDDVLQTQGSAFCGYGRCDQITDSLEGVTQYQRQRSFEFRLSDGLESYVWYKGNLLTVGDVIKSTGATAVKSHVLKEMPGEDQDGDVPSSSQLALIHDPAGKPCYLIPPAERPDPKSLTIQTIGHMCNDLAGGERGQTEGGYDAASERNNLLVLVPRVTVNDDGVLEPTGMPILTLAQSVYVGNVGESMEVGLRYGDSYWSRESS